METKENSQSQLRERPQRQEGKRGMPAWLLPTVGGAIILTILAFLGFRFFAGQSAGHGYSSSGYSSSGPGSSSSAKLTNSSSGCFLGQGQSQANGKGCAQGFDPLGDSEFTSTMKSAVSAKLQLTSTQIQGQLFPNGQPGPSIASLATQHGMTADQWHTFALTTAQQAMTKAVSEGKIKQPDADKLTASWQQQPDNLDKLITFMYAPIPASSSGTGY